MTFKEMHFPLHTQDNITDLWELDTYHSDRFLLSHCHYLATNLGKANCLGYQDIVMAG